MNPPRADLIAAAWSASSWQFPDGYTADDFEAETTDWEFWPVVVCGEMAGAIMVLNHLMHVCIKPEYFKRWATPGLYRRVLKHWRKCGRLETKVHVDHVAGRAFVERFGFRLVGCQGLTQIYELR